MSKFCTECGFENIDGANFCANCGKSIEEDSKSTDNQLIKNTNPLQVPKKYSGYNLTEEAFCSNCKRNTLIHLNKKSLLSSKEVYFCTNCGLTLEKFGEGYRLNDILDKNNRMWQLYKNKIFTIGEWERIADGGLSNKDQIEKDKELVVQGLSKGKIKLKPINSPVILKKNEEAYLTLPNITLSEPRAVRVSKRAGSGASFRVAKGMIVHSGGSKCRSVSHEEIMAIDTGTLVITNKRVIYVGNKKTVHINLKKILSMNIYKDGISVQRENKQKVEYFTKTNKHSMDFTLNGRQQNLVLEGYLVRAIIFGQIANL